MQRLVVEALADRRLDDVEIGRDVEIARAVQRGVADFQNLLQRLQAARERDLGQDRIAHGAERVRDQRRADQPRRIARAERDHAPAPALRHRQRQQIAHQVDDVLDVIGEADAGEGIGAHCGAVVRGQADRPADAGVEAKIFRQRRRYYAFADIGLDQNVRLAVRAALAFDRPDIERRMRPRRLREIFDDAGDVVVALDQEHIAGRQRLAQSVRVARRERLIAAHRLLKIAGDQLPEAIAHSTHEPLPAPVASVARLVASLFGRILWQVRCVLVHGPPAPLTET